MTSHVTELETSIDSVTKSITDIKVNIENITIYITNIVNHREELKNEYKSTTKIEDKTKIQEQIDELTS